MIGVLNERTVDDLFNYYKSQIFKMLGMFENKDINGFKYAIRILSEMGQFPKQLPKLDDDYRYNIVLAKVDVLAEELYFLDGEHQFVRNHTFEAMNLLDDIREGLR